MLMKAPVYKERELQAYAERILKRYNPAMLDHPVKDFDVYDVVEKILKVPYDWQYLSKDGNILGMTAFNSGYIFVWDENSFDKDKPEKCIKVEENTILIDRRVNEGNCPGRENFTVMHEVFHQLLHKSFFKSLKDPNQVIHHYNSIPSYRLDGHRILKTDLDWVEWQADTCAACFLMPEKAVRHYYAKVYGEYKIFYEEEHPLEVQVAAELAELFHVSRMAMWYRLSKFKLVSGSL